MKLTDTISVNPGKTTLGEVENASTGILRSHVLNSREETTSINLTKVIFPSINSGLSEYAKYAVPMRTLFATILIISGLTMLNHINGMAGTACGICTLCFGGFLALGLFLRPVMAGAAIYYCILGAVALRGGMTDLTLFSLMFGCLIFCLIGGGKYSCDTLIRRGIRRHKIKKEKKRHEEMMGYRAFHNARF
ncbi:MAG: hypothetical protein J1F12_08735 [Muribaculaceae bacterium]|nr:hypothetical protein [Muribaculaceae bacterium]